MNSGTVLGGTDGLISSTFGARVTPETGAKSRFSSNLRLSKKVAVIAFAVVTYGSVYPSGADRATASPARLLEAPVRFSTITGWPIRSDTNCALSRATMSAEAHTGKQRMR